MNNITYRRIYIKDKDYIIRFEKTSINSPYNFFGLYLGYKRGLKRITKGKPIKNK